MGGAVAGRWALILGVSSGMGRATAQELARAGMHIAGVHLDPAAAEPSVSSLVAELHRLGVRTELRNANAARAGTRAELVTRLAEATDGAGVRVLLHSLAFGALAPYLGGDRERLSSRQLEMTLDVMAHSLVYWVQELVAAGLLTRGAQVLAMTSAGTARVSASYGAVSAAKCALEAHVRQLAVELAPAGVAVNAIRAGVTATPALTRIPEHAELLARARAGNPHGRLTTPDDVAAAVLLLAGAGSSWLTGNVIGVDGGEGLTT